MEPPRCGDLSRVFPQLDSSALMRGAEKYFQNEEHLQQILGESEMDVVVPSFLGALLLRLLSPESWWAAPST